MTIDGSSRSAAPLRHGPARLPALAAALAVALAAGLAGGGCGLFTPAQPEPPGGGADVALPNLTTSPDSAIYSLELGLVTKNLQYYEHAIAETTAVTDADFHAVFDPQDTLDYYNGTHAFSPQDWTSQNEKSFFSFFASLRPVSYTVILTPDASRPDQPGPQVTILYRHYRIFAGSEPLAVGLADLTLRRVGVSQEWKVTYWVDRRDTTANLQTYGKQRLYSPR